MVTKGLIKKIKLLDNLHIFDKKELLLYWYKVKFFVRKTTLKTRITAAL